MRRLVLIADIVGSRKLDAPARRLVQQRVLGLSDGEASFRFTGGDEFEWSLPDAPGSLDRVLELRLTLGLTEAEGAEGAAPAVDLRVALGRGEVTVTSRQGPYAEDGPAYHHARQAMQRLRAPPGRLRRTSADPFAPGPPPVRWTAWVDERPRPERDALLVHMDRQFARWSPAQRQAIALALRGVTYQEGGRLLGITPQAFQGRLKSADLDLYLMGHGALKSAWEGP